MKIKSLATTLLIANIQEIYAEILVSDAVQNKVDNLSPEILLNKDLVELTDEESKKLE